MKAIGLDLGTTTLSAVVLDGESGRVLKALNLPNDANLKPDLPCGHLQDGDKIAQKALDMVESLCAEYGPVGSVGIDGQMHGIMYLDRQGRAISPLYTWQDGRGDLPYEGTTYAAALSRESGCPMASGFGLTTHYWHVKNGRVPQGAAAITTLFDYVGMKLTSRTAPLMHASGAASMGLYDVGRGGWDVQAVERAGVEAALLPRVTGQCAALGRTQGGIPVSCGIGDNQASFIGSVREMDKSILINMGTGGQVSMMTGAQGALQNCERRPLAEGHVILAGSSLCGGRAYALLENFVRSCAALAGYHGGPLYEAMNQAALKALNLDDLWAVDTRFSGTRRQPHLRGGMAGIATGNFDAAHLLGGTLLGMAGELYDLYGEMLAAGAARAGAMIGSGNAIRRNPALKLAFEKTFDLPMSIPVHVEEAAYGAALFGMVCAGQVESLAQAQRLIAYQG